MAASTVWKEYNDPSGTGISETTAAACNWQASDAYQPTVGSLVAVPAGAVSFHKIQALLFTAGTADAHVSALSYYISDSGDTNPTAGPKYWQVAAAVPTTGTFYAQPSNGSALTTIGGATMSKMPTASGTLTGTWGNATAPGTSHTPTNGPFNATGGSGSVTPITINGSVTNGGTASVLYATALYTQLITKTGAGAGSIGSLSITATWTES